MKYGVRTDGLAGEDSSIRKPHEAAAIQCSGHAALRLTEHAADERADCVLPCPAALCAILGPSSVNAVTEPAPSHLLTSCLTQHSIL